MTYEYRAAAPDNLDEVWNRDVSDNAGDKPWIS